MVFIVGGAYQGKYQYAKEKYIGYEIINSYNKRVREQVSEGLDTMKLAEDFLEEYKAKNGSLDKLVIISDELGYGVVPMDKLDRQAREANGRVNCMFAEKAEEVIRVTYGIGNKIK